MLEQLSQAIIKGTPTGEELARKALKEGATPTEVLSKAVTPAIVAVGEKMEAGEYSALDVLLSARTAEEALSVLKPLKDTVGTVVIGAVEDDFDGVIKDLTAMLLEGSGFQVVDLGFDASARQFVNAVLENRAKIVVMSAHLATTMPAMKRVIQALQESGYRGHVKVLATGAAVTQNYASAIGADGYAANAAAALRLAQKWVRGGS